MELQRQIRELKQEFAPPPSRPDSVQLLTADLWAIWVLIVLFHSHGWDDSSNGLEEIVRLLGIPEFIEWNVNFPGRQDALCELCCERTLTKLRTIVVEGRGGKWSDDKRIDIFSAELEALYSDIPVYLKHKYQLPGSIIELYSRAEVLLGQK